MGHARALAAAGLVAAGLTVIGLPAGPAHALDPVNPVRVDLGGHPANSGFLVFVEGDIRINSDESEGTMAAGGDLVMASGYNVAAGAVPVNSTFTAPGDSGPTYLYVGGGVSWTNPVSINVENSGFTKIADTSTYDAFNRDNNGAVVNYRVVPQGQPYNADRFIEGRTNAQDPASIAEPVPSSLIDIPAAFDLYRDLTTEMAACPDTVTLTNAQGDPTPRPVPPGTAARFELTPGQTNVLELTSAELDNLSELTFVDQPGSSTPLLVNVTGGAYAGDIPNLAGISGSQAPYILWNFPDAATVTVTGGATIEGTIYAPNATLTWLPTLNIEGNVIAANFNHGQLGRAASPREIHDFPFAATLSCAAGPASADLTLVKEVVNDDGGTAAAIDWTLSADGPTPISGATGDDDITAAEVEPGDYDLSEDGPGGYETDGWSCTGGELNGTTVTVDPGASVVCTIVNDDVPDEGPTPTESPTTTPPTPTESPSISPSAGPTSSPGVGPGSGALPATGGPSVLWLALGSALVAGGVALVALARRRGTH